MNLGVYLSSKLSKTNKTKEAKAIWKQIKTGDKTKTLTRREAFIVRFTRWEWPLRKDGWFPDNFPPFKATPENSPHQFAKKGSRKPPKTQSETLDKYMC